MTRLVLTALAIGLLATYAFAQGPARTDATVRGVVFTVDASGARAVIPAAKVSLAGPVQIEAESDNEGKFAFNTVPSGSYTITAQAPGMTFDRRTVEQRRSIFQSPDDAPVSLFEF